MVGGREGGRRRGRRGGGREGGREVEEEDGGREEEYLPPPRGTLTGMFNAWVWSLATVKASCTRSPWVNGMFNV